MVCVDRRGLEGLEGLEVEEGGIWVLIPPSGYLLIRLIELFS